MKRTIEEAYQPEIEEEDDHTAEYLMVAVSIIFALMIGFNVWFNYQNRTNPPYGESPIKELRRAGN